MEIVKIIGDSEYIHARIIHSLWEDSGSNLGKRLQAQNQNSLHLGNWKTFPSQ